MTEFEKKFWQEALDETAIIIHGNCYHIAPENAIGFRGFDGAKFKIRFLFDDVAGNWKKGETIVTTNLWHQGKIPEDFEAVDNAECVKEKGFAQLI